MSRILFLIVEGRTDATILRTLLDCSRYEHVRIVLAGALNNMLPIARSLRLMYTSADTIIVFFDSDSENPQVADEKVLTTKFLLNTDVSQVKIGVFCMTPNIDVLFGEEKILYKNNKELMENYMREHIVEMRSNSTIQSVQQFIDAE